MESTIYSRVMRSNSFIKDKAGYHSAPYQFFFLLAMIGISSSYHCQAQFTPPADSLFRPGVAMIQFNEDQIDPDYFCEHPWNPPGAIDSNFRAKPVIDPNIDPST